MFIGIDLGTSGLKAILLDRNGAVRASVTMPLTVAQPQPLWREQNPADWWQATEQAISALWPAPRNRVLRPIPSKHWV